MEQIYTMQHLSYKRTYQTFSKRILLLHHHAGGSLEKERENKYLNMETFQAEKDKWKYIKLLHVNIYKKNNFDPLKKHLSLNFQWKSLCPFSLTIFNNVVVEENKTVYSTESATAQTTTWTI